MTHLSTRRFLQIAGIAAAGLLLAACGKKEAPPAPAASASAAAPAAAPAKVYVVGTDAAYAPFESQNEKGEIVGFDIEVVQAVAKKAGIELKFVNTPWEGIFNALGQGDRDMIVSAVTITAERKGTMDFSDPYFDAQQLIAIKQTSKISKFADGQCTFLLFFKFGIGGTISISSHCFFNRYCFFGIIRVDSS